MALKIFWTDFVKLELKKFFKYLKEHASLKVAKNENRKIILATLRLKSLPEIGAKEPKLTYSSKKYRYLIHQFYKIIYWINQEKRQIEIMDVFDTHQLPDKIKRTK